MSAALNRDARDSHDADACCAAACSADALQREEEGEVIARNYVTGIAVGQVEAGESAAVVSVLCHSRLFGFCRVIETALGVPKG